MLDGVWHFTHTLTEQTGEIERSRRLFAVGG